MTMANWHCGLTTTSSQHARPSGVLRRRSDGLERAAWRPSRPVAQCRHFQEEAEDASVSECTWTRSALEALRNALYKFKTYLLTYLRCLIISLSGVGSPRLSYRKLVDVVVVVMPMERRELQQVVNDCDSASGGRWEFVARERHGGQLVCTVDASLCSSSLGLLRRHAAVERPCQTAPGRFLYVMSSA